MGPLARGGRIFGGGLNVGANRNTHACVFVCVYQQHTFLSLQKKFAARLTSRVLTDETAGQLSHLPLKASRAVDAPGEWQAALLGLHEPPGHEHVAVAPGRHVHCGRRAPRERRNVS